MIRGLAAVLVGGFLMFAGTASAADADAQCKRADDTTISEAQKKVDAAQKHYDELVKRKAKREVQENAAHELAEAKEKLARLECKVPAGNGNSGNGSANKDNSKDHGKGGPGGIKTGGNDNGNGTQCKKADDKTIDAAQKKVDALQKHYDALVKNKAKREAQENVARELAAAKADLAKLQCKS